MSYTLTQDQQVSTVTLNELFGRAEYTIFYFYPKDDTPGCTTEALDFTGLQKDFTTYGVQVVGVSRDSHERHCSFQKKHGISLPLITDNDLELHTRYGAWGKKNNYGKIITGVIRSTFLIDTTGMVIKERKNVRAKGHAAKILSYVEAYIHNNI